MRYPTPNLKFALAPTPTPDASQWNIGGVGSQRKSLALAMYISFFLCRFHSRWLPNANPISSGIWALVYHLGFECFVLCIDTWNGLQHSGPALIPDNKRGYSLISLKRPVIFARTVFSVVSLTISLMGPLTLKFDRATLPFLKIDMRHEAYRHGKKY